MTTEASAGSLDIRKSNAVNQCQLIYWRGNDVISVVRDLDQSLAKQGLKIVEMKDGE